MMKKTCKAIPSLLIICAAMLQAPAVSCAWEPNSADLTAAVNSGNLAPYAENLTRWLNDKAPSAIKESTMRTLLKDPTVINALLQRTFLWKANPENFLKAGASNKAFILWVMQDPKIMELILIGAAPVNLRQREDNSFGIGGGVLEIWKKIYDADPDSKQGLYLRLAMATALNPPGTGCRGSGQAAVQETPLARYLYLKDSHRKKELSPEFDGLTVWEMRQVTCCMASNVDMTWGRQMVNTWNPEFRNSPVDTTSQVWRRNSPISHGNSYRNVMAGGGKCGPRSSWSVFICQAWGIPATGVGQPAHACVAYRMADGNWRTAYGRSWAASKLLGMSGNEFVEGISAMLQRERFAFVEHMRWFAAALPATKQGPILELAKAVTRAPPVIEVPAGRNADTVTALTRLEAPKDDGDSFIARIRGFLYPPASGDYVFGTSADDESDLFLSESASPDDKKLIAFNREWTEAKKFDAVPSQKSVPIRLEAGKKYYIEVVHKENAGGDHVEVGWKGPGIGGDIIPGANLSPYPTGAQGNIFREVWRPQAARPAPAVVAAAKPPAAATPATPPPPPVFSAVNGVIHVDAGSFYNNGGIAVFGGHPGVQLMDSYPSGTGKQIHFAANMGTVYAGWKINVPETGIYNLSAQVATVNFDQSFCVKSYGAMYTPKSAKASHVWHNEKSLAGDKACDNDPSTRWAVTEGTEICNLELDLGEPKPISVCQIDERFFNRISKFNVEYKVGNEWKKLFEDTNIGIVYEKTFPPVTAQYVRLNTLDGRENGGPTIWEFEVGTTKNGVAWMPLPCTYGLWAMTKPVEIRLVRGQQTIWFMAPFQRGVSLKSFNLRLKGTAQTAYTPAATVGGAKTVPSSQLKNNSGEDPE